MSFEPQRLRGLAVLLPLTTLLWTGRLFADAGHCDICGGVIADTAYTMRDKVTEENRLVCPDCTLLNTVCFICGLPAKTNYTALSDGRILCARDAKTAVIEEENARQICRETRDSLDQLFSRFLAFPETNVQVAIVDRVNLQTLFKFAGNDYQCPNVWGYLETRTNHARLEHKLSLLSALPVGAFKATCAHEYTHAWLNENLPEARMKQLSQDAIEGFCELISYRLIESQNEQAAKKQITLNAYTRGQIHLFLEAEKRYGFNDIVDWMKYGTDDRLKGAELERVRSVDMPRPAVRLATKPVMTNPEPAPVPDVLVLKGISGTRLQPLALINDRTFAVNEEGKVRVGKTNCLIRCLAIRGDGARIRMLGSGEELELRLKHPAP